MRYPPCGPLHPSQCQIIRPNAPAVVAGQQQGFLLRGLGPGLLLHIHTHCTIIPILSFLNPSPALGGGWYIQVRTPEVMGPACRTWIQAHPAVPYPQLRAVPAGVPERNPGTRLPSSPLRASWASHIPETERRSSGDPQLL